ncbi:MAG TPA: VTT domain-containing protein, partial [Limnochordia bacterium]|nr:VTT domain-containing protein [Limnochordia bacterium]
MDPQKLLADLGAVGIIVTTFLDGLNAPIPSEVLLPLIGALAAEGSFHPLAAIALAWLGTVGGACAAYGLGRFASVPLKRWFRYDPAAHTGWRRWGDATLVVGRWLPGIRTLISFPAGASRINFWRYTAL